MNTKLRRKSVYNVSEKDFELILEATKNAEEMNFKTKEKVEGCKKKEVVH